MVRASPKSLTRGMHAIGIPFVRLRRGCLPRFVCLSSPIGTIESSAGKCQDAAMRVNLITRPADRLEQGIGTIPLSLTIRPACGLPGDYECPTDSAALLRLLRRQTDLPAYVLQNFEKDLGTPHGARLLGVNLSDSVLTDIGYFID